MEKLQAKWDEGKFVCVGLDSDLDHPLFPQHVPIHPWVERTVNISIEQRKQLSFNCWIVDATKDLAGAYKPNLAFYKKPEGKQVLRMTIRYIRKEAWDMPVILDAKQGDIDNTNNGYVDDDFEYYEAGVVTVSPYLGMEANRPFLDWADKGIILLCKTSNKGSGEFQNLLVPKQPGMKSVYKQVPLYQAVAHNVATNWNYNGNCAVVVGATYPEELAEVRKIVGDMPILLPGIGAQGGDLEATVQAGRNSRDQGMIVNNSRGIIFASSGDDFADAAQRETLKMHNAIQAALKA